MTTAWVDIETRSRVDLKKSNVYRYVQDPDFRILMMAYAIDDGPVEITTDPHEMTQLLCAWLEAGDTIVAHNAQFERIAFSAHLQGYPDPRTDHAFTELGYLNPEYFDDSAALAAVHGYPAKLETLARWLGGEKKDAAGAALIRWFSMPSRRGAFNTPEDAPEKWEDFKRYCAQDVETHRDAYRRLPGWPGDERAVWLEDQRINDRGIRVDVAMATEAVQAAEDNRLEQELEFSALTGVVNPGSTQQVMAWLEESGLPLPNLQKATVEEALARDDLQPVHRRALELRMELALVASKKYQAALDRVSPDDRLRGSFQYFGAHTGRWSGRGVQLQNLPSATISPEGSLDLDAAIEAYAVDVALGSGASAHVLKALVRSMFVGPFTVVDYAAIEARVLAWICGETWALEAFRAGRDIYVETAERANLANRKEGKVACIAEGSLVLTDHGEVPIEEVTTEMKMWDGIEWVSHDGVVYKGMKEVIEYDGLTATEDHVVWVEGEARPIRFRESSSRGARLTRSGDGGRAVRVGEGHIPQEDVRLKMGQPESPGRMYELWCPTVGTAVRPEEREDPWVPAVQPAEEPDRSDAAKDARSVEAMRRQEQPGLPVIRRTRNQVQFSEYRCSGEMGGEEPRLADSRANNRPDRQRRALRAREHSVGDHGGAVSESQVLGAERVQAAGLAVQQGHRDEKTTRRKDPGRDDQGGAAGGSGEAESLAHHRGTARVYDIVNSGPRQRFTVSGRLVHNCLALGYNGGIGSLRAMGAEGTDAYLQHLVDQWRGANRNITAFWQQLGEVFWTGGKAGRVHVSRSGSTRRIHLPSGRAITYHGVRRVVQQNRWGSLSPQLSFRDPKLGLNGRTDTYGGKICENVTQAIARDVLADALRALGSAGYRVVGHVHDEVLVEGLHPVEEISGIMCSSSPWAEGLPLDAEGASMPRYRKG